MYKRLTIAYGTLCRDSTPLILTWEQEDEKYPTIEDEAMTKLFSKLQPAFEVFCKYLFSEPSSFGINLYVLIFLLTLG